MKPFFKTKNVLIVVLLVVFLVVLNLTNFSKDLRNLFFLASEPIQKVFLLSGDKITDYFEAFFYVQKLQDKNEKFKLKIQELNAEIVNLRELKQENIVLREALNIGLQEEFKMVFVQIISKDIAQDSFIINKGLKDGLLENMPVITQQKILVGKVSQVYDNYSRVMLVSNKESVIPVNIQNQKEEMLINTEAIMKGKENFQIELNYIPLEAEIKNGDNVVTSALGGFFPLGILIGYVKNVEILGVELFQKAEVQLPIDLREINYLFVITDF